jgi:hypothetical protein
MHPCAVHNSWIVVVRQIAIEGPTVGIYRS